MNYFELYGFPVLMKMDANELKSRFEELRRRYHPNEYSPDSESKTITAGEESLDIEKAYKVFQNPDDLILYVLKLRNLVAEDEKYELGPDFMAETTTITDQLTELELSPDPERLEDCESQAKELIRKDYELVAPLIEQYREDTTTEKELLQVKDYYYGKKYLQRILDRIYQIRNIASQF